MSKKNKKYRDYLDGLLLEDIPIEETSTDFSWSSFEIEEEVQMDSNPTEQDVFDNESQYTCEIAAVSHEDDLDIEQLPLNFLQQIRYKEDSEENNHKNIIDGLISENESPLSVPDFPAAQQNLSDPLSPQKVKGGKKDLFSMEQILLENVTIISHDEGLYYFNGKAYSAIRNDLELLGLIRNKVSPSAFSVSSTRPFQDLMTFLKSDPNLIPNKYEKKLEKAKRLVVLENGVLDISRLELLDFHPKYLVFHSINASWTDHYPKTFMKFLRLSCQYNEEVVRLASEVIGYLLSGSNQAKAFFVIGVAMNSGKSTLANLLKKLIGDEFTCSIEPNRLHERFSLGSSRGKVLNLAMDIPKGRLCAAAVSRIKTITGLDSISIEEKYQRVENTVSSLRFLFGTNHPVRLSKEDDDDDAFWERMIVIPFMHSVKPEEKDPDLFEKLWKERDAIVSYCLRSYKTVLENGYVFSPCKASEDMKASWRHDDTSSYTFANFWTDFVEVTGDMGDQVFAQSLYDKYIIYCQDKNIVPIYYTKMRDWIETHIDQNLCFFKRIRKNEANARAGYCGIKIHY